MKRIALLSIFLLLVSVKTAFSQTSEATAYLLTCGPGTETYSIYGHSALRIVIPASGSDSIYNWGVFDFDTPNFAWKFAKGRLDYMLIAESVRSFVGVYQYEHRYVYSQKLNINPAETRKLVELVNENLRPENIKYRYDFFYDDCSTRIRDIIEKAIGDKLRYPPDEKDSKTSFRDMVAKYQRPYPWLRFGVDLIMGSTADKKVKFRERMFLPVDMMEGLSGTRVQRDGKMIPLLQNPVVLVDFQTPDLKPGFFTAPPFVFSFVLILVLIVAALTKNRKLIRLIDILIYSVFSILALLMIFFNFFTDHIQMQSNLNIIWLNPIIIVCLIMLIIKKPAVIWFRIEFFITAGFLIVQFILPQDFDFAFSLLAMILLVRTSVRSEFVWNPLTMK
jgi:hypothetical protein